MLTGVATAFGLSACAVVLGAFLARGLDIIELLPDGYAPSATAVFAAVGTVGAGATVAEVAGRRALHAIVIAGVLVFFGLREIMRSVETTGAEGSELPVVAGFAVLFVVLLGLGTWLRRRRLPSTVASS